MATSLTEVPQYVRSPECVKQQESQGSVLVILGVLGVDPEIIKFLSPILWIFDNVVCKKTTWMEKIQDDTVSKY